MKVCSVENLLNQNFNLVFVNALQQFWHNTNFFQCIGAPKKVNLFLFVCGCKVLYTDKNNNTYIANSGDIVYTPIGSEYKVELCDFENSDSHTVGINFFLYDEKGEDIILSDGIEIFHSDDKIVSSMFHQSIYHDIIKQHTKNRILLMEILCALSQDSKRKSATDNVTKALAYLSENIEESPSISKLAEVCNVSEVYLRRQFKNYVGMSPVEYRNTLRLDRAKTYLEYGEISVQEISDALGYSTVSHFIKEFKNKFGISPLKYRQKTK
jgi:AraC-like DNA-binding protein